MLSFIEAVKIPLLQGFFLLFTSFLTFDCTSKKYYPSEPPVDIRK